MSRRATRRPLLAAAEPRMTMRSLLFVPVDREKYFAKSEGLSADALILDLEDTVAPARKTLVRCMVTARRVADAFASAGHASVVGLDGRRLDIPHLRQAVRVLAWASAVAPHQMPAQKKTGS